MISKSVLKNHVSIPTGDDNLPIEITIIGKFTPGSTKEFINVAFKQQAQHPAFVEAYNEPSALIGKPTFPNKTLPINDDKFDPTALYTFGIDTRDLVFHRHEGHRVIIGISGIKGCILRFSLCTPKEAEASPHTFLQKMYVIKNPGDRLFSLRFNGKIYHQFSPVGYTEHAFFAVSVHTNETGGLSGNLLEKVLANEGSIPLLTEPVATTVLDLLKKSNAYQFATFIYMD